MLPCVRMRGQAAGFLTACTRSKTSLEGEQGMPPRSHSASAQRQQKDGTVASGAKSSATGKHPRRYWQDMTTEDFAALSTLIVSLPSFRLPQSSSTGLTCQSVPTLAPIRP